MPEHPEKPGVLDVYKWTPSGKLVAITMARL